MPLPRRRLSELLDWYLLEKKIADLFVEGPSDKAILAVLFSKHCPPGSKLYAVDEIEIDCIELNNKDGARGRVLKLSKKLEDAKLLKSWCLVDRDLDSIMSSVTSGPNLLVTEFSDLILHIFKMKEFIDHVARVFYAEISEKTVEAWIKAAQIFFAIRVDRYLYKPSHVMANFDKALKVKNGILSLDLDSYLMKLDSRNGSGGYWMGRKTEIVGYLNKMKGNHFCYCNSHDLNEILTIFFARVLRIKLQDFWLEHYLRGEARYEHLEKVEFFKMIASRVAA